ncbi:phage virion morphogenesis protein [Desulfovibrio aminophilus]|uniref:phage virion morphogenesis protein n=1 Tax=Desulfovibrio aminophilus TaxID=81425 RepID=UPI00041CFD44|nr:phage virion morphogenesis protein [Desulfovibrio aminophilus]
MAGASLTWTDDEVQAELTGVAGRMADLTPAMRATGELLRTSVIRNFEVGGRPQRWAPLKPSTLARRRSSGGPLVVRGMGGGLMGSITAQASAASAIVGTNKVHAAVHQFGAAKGQFGSVTSITPGKYGRTRTMTVPWGTIPARPFMVVQEEDETDIREIIREFVVAGSAG